MNLDYSSEQFKALLYQASDHIVDLYDSLASRKAIQYPDCKDVKALFEEPLPQTPEEPKQLLDKAARQFFDTASLNIGPAFFAYVMSGGTQMGIVAEMLTAAMNQNVSKWHLAPGAVEAEKQVIRWLAEFIGYKPDAGGVLVSGGSMANLTCLSVARKVMTPWDVSQQGYAGHKPVTVYASTETHACVDKSIEALGIGKQHLRKVPVKQDLTIDTAALEAMILSDSAQGMTPICIIGNAGTVNTGAIDPLNELADLAEKYGLWFHVDGAYGVPAASVDALKSRFAGIERADSVAIDPHKWLYVPFETGCALIRRWGELKKTYSVLPDYLNNGEHEKFEPFEHIFQLSRNAKAVKVWMTLKAYGAQTLTTAIQDNIQIIQHLRNRLEKMPQFEILAPASLSILCFRYLGENAELQDEASLDALNLAILNEIEQDGRVFLTGTKIHGKQALRLCCVNHRTNETHLEQMLAVVSQLGRQTEEKLCYREKLCSR